MAYDKHKMQDISATELALWMEYLECLKGGDLASAQQILSLNPSLKYKVFNAFNWNRLQNLINDANDVTDATNSSLVGMWNADYGILLSVSKNFIYRGDWSSGTQYDANNSVKTDDQHIYFCMQTHTSTTDTKPPNQTYWMLASKMLDSVGIQVAPTAPTNLTVGDIYFKTVT